MSLMTENLLLQAQTLRIEGVIDASIDLLRVVISQCNSDLQHTDGNSGDNDDQSSAVEDEGESKSNTTTKHLRQMASYQLALLLLQRSGRVYRWNANNNNESDDEVEADTLLLKLGYRLRLSKIAFGYPICSCNHSQTKNNKEIKSELSSKLMQPITIENVLPTSIFDALQYSFRPESRYWNEFYCKVSSNTSDDTDDTLIQKKTNQFASHNIPIPTLPSSVYSDSIQQSKSLLEQVAIITQHQLKCNFPDIMNATSVEVWAHRRPLDGQHQLHYDLDEILLWKHRKGQQERDETITAVKDGAKRLKTTHRATSDSDYSGISCPIVSCVLTIYIPNQQLGTCSICGSIGNSAPTIICNQSIKDPDCSISNNGYLCYPYPNRLLAFEGSMLHGVMPGIPQSSSTSSDDENGSSCSDDSCNLGSQKASNKTAVSDGNQRITLMIGYWKKVCLGSGEVGPNVPFDSLPQQCWKTEFNSILNTSKDDMAHSGTKTNQRKDVIDPLWVKINAQGEKEFGDYSASDVQHGRFFLQSSDSRDIDKQVLSGV
jgi:hypothetical protein